MSGRSAGRLAVVTAAADVVEAELVDDETAGASVVVPTGRDRHLSPGTVAAVEASRSPRPESWPRHHGDPGVGRRPRRDGGRRRESGRGRGRTPGRIDR
ncbi:hypothetical protein [Streptomyces hyderabadensis]|uniref:hypothetical protein n=1 Tax=Streptomyces hyderabadensis TaxID=598549 RepID=UPI001CF09ABB|nr:hypothetical protein [Streptomyces hyderabadensis]